MSVEPFRINATDADLEDLHSRLVRTRLPEAETPDDWSQGIPLAYMREVIDYWRDHYDWRAREARINAFDQFRTSIDGFGVHFVHVRSKAEDAAPLLMTHGWPGSIVEFLKVIGPLTDPEAHGGDAKDAFHIVCPSLPGYGFSDKPSAPGTGVEAIADLWSKLMRAVGYERYFAQGGDWGAMVTTHIGARDPEGCLGIHLNMPIIDFTKLVFDKQPSPRELEALADGKHYQDWESGYSKQQSTRPQTLGYSLVDSPAGQAAWILEKFWAWTDCDGHPENVLGRDELLDNVMMYWLPAAGASSARLYWESFASDGDAIVDVPMAGSIFPKEIFRITEAWAAKRYRNIVYWNELDKGGHFAAFEQPELFVEEIRSAFRLMR